MVKVILASKSKVRKEFLDKNNIVNEVIHSNVDEDIVKKLVKPTSFTRNNFKKFSRT